jgi:ubiquinol-cytochrome c reductase cytochrome b subunit
MFVLIAVHLYLVLEHGISEPPRAGEPVDRRTYRERYAALLHREGVPFWPDAAWKDVVFALFIGCIVLLLSIVLGPADLGKQADPTVVQADPRPDWYFLWYFALLALLPSGAENWFIVGFPVLIGLALLALPFVAPTGERSPRRRPWAVAVVGIPLVSIAALVQLGNTAPWSPAFQPAPLPPSVTAGLTGEAARGAQLFQAKDCIACHAIAGSGGQRGPDLTTVGDRLSRDELTWRILTGGTNMPAFGTNLQPNELNALVEFLVQQRGRAS